MSRKILEKVVSQDYKHNISLTTSPAIKSPAAEGTKLMLAGEAPSDLIGVSFE